MATIKWLGGTDTASATAANWKGGSVPGANDVALFDNEGLADCAWTLTSSGSLTVSEIVIESNFDHQVILNAIPFVKGLYLNGILNAGSAGTIVFQHGASPNFFGTYKTYNERFILIDSNASYVGDVTFSLEGSASPLTKFDDGNHPIVRLTGGKFAPDYVAPTSTSGKATFTSFTIASGVNFLPDGALVDNDRLKVFSFDAVTMTDATTVDFGLSTVEFTATSSGIQLPVEGATGYPATFLPYYRKVVLKANTAGHKILMADNTFLSVEELEIQDGVMFLGPQTATAQGADIRSMKTPVIRGTWSFSQISAGVYRSPRHASGPMPKVNGNFHITGKLDVDGLIDPTGLELNPQGSNPGGTAANTLWLNSGDSNKLYHGSSEVGGGGGGITALTGEVTASGSGSVAATIANDSVTDDKLANATLAKIDGALPKAGGTMTGEIEATTITLNAVPADPATDGKVRIGESGGTSNMFQIQTNDGYIRLGPNNTTYGHLYTDRAQFYFNNPILVDGGGQIFAFNDGLKLGTGTTVSGGTVAITVANGSEDITVAGDIAVGGTVDGIDIATDVAANTAKVTNATHSGEVTGATALTIADNVVDEANLKVSNTPTNGYALTAQSGASGGLTWAAMSGGAPALQYLRLFMKNLSGNSNNYTATGSYQILDIANTSNWGESTTGTHNDITVTNASSDHIVLGAGGLYHIIVTMEFFPVSGVTDRDMWLVVSTDTSSTGQLGNARSQNGVDNIKLQHSTYHEVASGGSDDDIYFSIRSNGNNSNIIAFTDHRTTIHVTRVGDSTV